MIDRKDWPEDARNAQAAFDEASWDAGEGYRDTGEMVPDDPAPMSRIGLKSKADRELFLKEIEPKLRACARLHPVKSTARADESGVLSLDATLQENSVVFFELDTIR